MKGLLILSVVIVFLVWLIRESNTWGKVRGDCGHWYNMERRSCPRCHTDQLQVHNWPVFIVSMIALVFLSVALWLVSARWVVILFIPAVATLVINEGVLRIPDEEWSWRSFKICTVWFLFAAIGLYIFDPWAFTVVLDVVTTLASGVQYIGQFLEWVYNL